MALGSISEIRLNRVDYSRYINAASRIQVRVMFTPTTGLAGEVLRVRLYRTGGWLVATETLTLVGSYPKGAVITFDLNNPDYFIEPKAGQRFCNMRCGEYYVVADEEEETAPFESERFWILPITVEYALNSRIFGTTFDAYDVKSPIQQPKNITGVTVNLVSDFMPLGPCTLKWDFSAKTLTLDTTANNQGGEGPAMVISPDRREYVVYDDTVVSGEEYLICDVDYYALPDDDQEDALFIEKAHFKDEYVRFLIMQAYNAVGFDLQVPVEPTWISTNRTDIEEVHEYTDPVNFNRFTIGQEFITVELPHSQILFLDKLTGALNDYNVVEIPDEFRVEYTAGGLVSFVPQNASLVQWLSPGIGYSLLNRYNNIPAFWHYRALVGLDTLNGKYSIVLEAIEKYLAIELFIIAGSAYRAGYSSESVARDGISASMTYSASAMYSMYGAEMEDYKVWLDKKWHRFKKQIQGIRAIML